MSSKTNTNSLRLPPEISEISEMMRLSKFPILSTVSSIYTPCKNVTSCQMFQPEWLITLHGGVCISCQIAELFSDDEYEPVFHPDYFPETNPPLI